MQLSCNLVDIALKQRFFLRLSLLFMTTELIFPSSSSPKVSSLSLFSMKFLGSLISTFLACNPVQALSIVKKIIASAFLEFSVCACLRLQISC